MLTGDITRKEPIPHEAGEWMVFRTLGWKQLEDASDARSIAAYTQVRAMGAEVYKSLESPADDTKTVADPLNKYDRATLLRFGIADWSYTAPCEPAAFDLLDAVTAEWAAREILKPSLRSEEQQDDTFPEPVPPPQR